AKKNENAAANKQPDQNTQTADPPDNRMATTRETIQETNINKKAKLVRRTPRQHMPVKTMEGKFSEPAGLSDGERIAATAPATIARASVPYKT
ncbi:MAG: hypothetical protein AAFV62_11315, partial [Pseudomonadota bacterium]